MRTSIPPAADFNSVLAGLEQRHQAFVEYASKNRPAFEKLPAQIPCEKHPKIKRQKDFDETMVESRRQGYFTPIYSACPSCLQEAQEARQRRFWRKRGVPDRVCGATFDNFKADTAEKIEVKNAVIAWVKRGGNFLLLTGTSGTGKGHLAVSCLKHGALCYTDGIAHFEIDGLFITHVDMMTDLRASYTLHTTKRLIESWKETPMFVLDEFGLSGGGGDEAPMLYQVLAERYDKKRPTILTSNLSLPEIKDALGARIIDRMGEDYTTGVCRWKSYRTK